MLWILGWVSLPLTPPIYYVCLQNFAAIFLHIFISVQKINWQSQVNKKIPLQNIYRQAFTKFWLTCSVFGSLVVEQKQVKHNCIYLFKVTACTLGKPFSFNFTDTLFRMLYKGHIIKLHKILLMLCKLLDMHFKPG